MIEKLTHCARSVIRRWHAWWPAAGASRHDCYPVAVPIVARPLCVYTPSQEPPALTMDALHLWLVTVV